MPRSGATVAEYFREFLAHLQHLSPSRYGSIAVFRLNVILTYSSFPDPRIWPNRVAALVGTVRSTVNLGISSATAVSEATIYGEKAIVMATNFILNAMKWVDEEGGFLPVAL